MAEQTIRFLICYRDSKCTGPFHEVFRGEQIRIVRTPDPRTKGERHR